MAVALPTERSRPTVDLSRQTLLVYGPPKIGKSTFASRFPETIFFECEPGLNQLEVFKVPTYSWEDFLGACKLVAELLPLEHEAFVKAFTAAAPGKNPGAGAAAGSTPPGTTPNGKVQK